MHREVMKMDVLTKGLFDSADAVLNLSVADFMAAVAVSILIGMFLAFAYAHNCRHTASMMLTLTFLPACVCTVIMMVNGNIGAGVAVAGAFSLVRFRSVPGAARDITVIFAAMGCGLICGMGYLFFAVLFAAITGGGVMLFTATPAWKGADNDCILTVSIPEDLNYCGMFDDLFERYATRWERSAVKSTGMGSIFKLVYDIRLKDMAKEKEFLDGIRTRNGNLDIMIARKADADAVL